MHISTCMCLCDMEICLEDLFGFNSKNKKCPLDFLQYVTNHPFNLNFISGERTKNRVGSVVNDMRGLEFVWPK